MTRVRSTDRPTPQVRSFYRPSNAARYQRERASSRRGFDTAAESANRYHGISTSAAAASSRFVFTARSASAAAASSRFVGETSARRARGRPDEMKKTHRRELLAEPQHGAVPQALRAAAREVALLQHGPRQLDPPQEAGPRVPAAPASTLLRAVPRRAVHGRELPAKPLAALPLREERAVAAEARRLDASK